MQYRDAIDTLFNMLHSAHGSGIDIIDFTNNILNKFNMTYSDLNYEFGVGVENDISIEEQLDIFFDMIVRDD